MSAQISSIAPMTEDEARSHLAAIGYREDMSPDELVATLSRLPPEECIVIGRAIEIASRADAEACNFAITEDGITISNPGFLANDIILPIAGWAELPDSLKEK